MRLNDSRRDEMRAAESRIEIIERDFVGYIDKTQTRRQFYFFRSQNIVRAETQIEQMTRRDARRIRVVVFHACRRNADARRAEIRRGAASERIGQSRKLIAAEQTDLLLFVSRKSQRRRKIRHRARHDAAVIAPGKCGERREFTERFELFKRILNLRRLLKRLIVVNAENAARQIRIEK